MLLKAWRLRRAALWLPGAILLQAACLPDNALRDVTAENITRTLTLLTSSIVATLFGSFFRF